MVASAVTIGASILLLFGGAGWYAQVVGDADVGGCVVWLILVIGFWLAWQAVKLWKAALSDGSGAGGNQERVDE